MLRFLLLPMILQVLFIVHVIKTGRSTSWILLLIFLPYAGGLAYFFVEILPSLFTHGRVERSSVSPGAIFNSWGKIRRLEKTASYSNTFENVAALGDAYLDDGQFHEAANTYLSCLLPPFENNEEYIYKMAYAYYKSSEYLQAEEVIRRIEEFGRGALRAKELLLKSFILEKLDRIDEARVCIQEACEKTGNLSYHFDYGRFLQRNGDNAGAHKTLLDLQESYHRLPRNFKKQYRSMPTDLRRELTRVKKNLSAE
jgi:hypothetical protein